GLTGRAALVLLVLLRLILLRPLLALLRLVLRLLGLLGLLGLLRLLRRRLAGGRAIALLALGATGVRALVARRFATALFALRGARVRALLVHRALGLARAGRRRALVLARTRRRLVVHRLLGALAALGMRALSARRAAALHVGLSQRQAGARRQRRDCRGNQKFVLPHCLSLL